MPRRPSLVLHRSLSFAAAWLTLGGFFIAGCASAPPADAPASGVSAAVAPSASPPQAAGPAWGIFTPEDGAFTAVFPSQPEETVQPVPGPAGKVDTHRFEAEGPGGSAYLVSWTDYPVAAASPDEVKKRLLSVRDSFVAAAQAKLVDDKEITSNGVPGREFTITMNVPEQVFSHTRVFMRGPRLYQFVAMIPADARNDDDVRTFLDSAVLGAAPAPSTTSSASAGPAAPPTSPPQPVKPVPAAPHP